MKDSKPGLALGIAGAEQARIEQMGFGSDIRWNKSVTEWLREDLLRKAGLSTQKELDVSDAGAHVRKSAY